MLKITINSQNIIYEPKKLLCIHKLKINSICLSQKLSYIYKLKVNYASHIYDSNSYYVLISLNNNIIKLNILNNNLILDSYFIYLLIKSLKLH